MFIIIIVVIGIILYLLNLNSRINKLESNFKMMNILSKSENVHQQIIDNTPNPAYSISSIDQPIEKLKVEEVVIHQDNFAKNLAKFGIAILVLGVLFFLNYLDKQGLLGPVFKYTAGLAFGSILLGIGEYLRNKTKAYVNLLRGAAFIIFYITLFIGYIVFKIVALPLTLGLVISVLTISIIISLRENDELPFTIGALGAYLVSFLINLNFYNLNQENTIGVLSYILILNIAVLIVSFKKQWINSGVIGFIFTWCILAFTLSSDIGKSLLFVFSSLYGLQYMIVFLLQDFKKDKLSHNTVFLTVINTLVYLMVFYKLVDKTFWFDYVGFFVALLGVFHFVVYMMLRGINKTSEGVITLTHFVISILLITVAIPLQFDGPLVTMIWFFEGIVLSFLAVLNDFKNKPIMYVLGFVSIVAGIAHMIMFGDYETVFDSGIIFINQAYIVWFAVFALINLIAYIWHNTVNDSENISFKKDINKATFSLILIGQIMFVILTSVEINNFGQYRVNLLNQEINKERELERQLSPDDYGYKYDSEKIENRYTEIYSTRNQTTFMQVLLFIFMTIIYFVIGLIKKNKIVRNMGIITLVITSVLLITLTWGLGPVYRIITFIGFGILLLIVSYLYISKNKNNAIPTTLMLFVIISLFSVFSNIEAKIIDIKDWTYYGQLQYSQIEVENNKDNENIYVLPINKDVVNLSKKYDLSDIRIIDKDNNEIPYILIKSNQNTQKINDDVNQVKILENSLTKDGKKILVLDTTREGVLYNNLHLSIDPNSKNFRKKVKIYISDTFLSANSIAWRELEQKSILYNYTDDLNFSVEKLDINLSGVSSRYIKLELIDDIDFDKNIKVNNQITINSAEIKYIKGEDKDIGYKIKDYLSGNFVFDNLSIYKDVDLLSQTQIDDKTEVVYKGDVDVETLTLRVDDKEKNFNRNVVIQGGDDGIEWITLGNSNIYRIDSPTYKGENLSIEINPSTYKKFKVIIQNNNNKPLDILKTGQIKLQNTGLIFKTDSDIVSDLRLIVGNNKEASPVYDIRSTINYFENTTPEIIQHQTLIKNPDYIETRPIIPFGEKNKVLLNVALLLFIIILGIFGFFWMKKDKHDEIK